MESTPHRPDTDPVGASSGIPGSGSSPAEILDFLSGLDMSTADDDTALEAVCLAERVMGYVHAVQVRALVRFARVPPDSPSDGAAARFDRYAADEVAAAVGWTHNTAATRIYHAVTLTDRLPAALSALERGDVDLYRTRILTDHTTPLDDAHAAAIADQVLAQAAGQNPTVFRRAVRRAVSRIDPEGEDRRHQTARADRKVAVAPLPDGMAELIATLPADQATAIYRRADALARANAVAGDGLTADARRADALVELVLHHPGGKASSGPLVQVTIPATTLAGADNHPGDLEGYGPIPPAMARRIANDPTGTWRRLITDPLDGSLLEYGRKNYKPPAALADHVKARDATCRFPGCNYSARHADIDHTVPYPKGDTTPGNLGALCRRHHRAKHNTTWTVTQRDGHFTWTSPTGRTYTRHPASYSEPHTENHRPP